MFFIKRIVGPYPKPNVSYSNSLVVSAKKKKDEKIEEK